MCRRAFLSLTGALIIPTTANSRESEIDCRYIIDTLTEYDVRHPFKIINPDTKMEVYGLTVWDEKTIYIPARLDLTSRRYSLLHELQHLFFRSHGKGNATEREVDNATEKQYRKIFGDF